MSERSIGSARLASLAHLLSSCKSGPSLMTDRWIGANKRRESEHNLYFENKSDRGNKFVIASRYVFRFFSSINTYLKASQTLEYGRTTSRWWNSNSCRSIDSCRLIYCARDGYIWLNDYCLVITPRRRSGWSCCLDFAQVYLRSNVVIGADRVFAAIVKEQEQTYLIESWKLISL